MIIPDTAHSVGNDFVLSGTSEKTLKLQSRARSELQKQLNRQAREQAKAEKQEKERRKTERIPTLCTMTHHPTYSVMSYKRADGLPGQRKPSASFTVKNEIQSMASQSRLKNAINWMLLFADKKRVYSKIEKRSYSFRLAFITLTLSDLQRHDDAFIKEHMLQPFLYWLQRYYNSLYVWKAESQLNGNIHFHITVDTFIPWRSVRAKWNKLLAKHQYCKVYQDGTNDRGNAATQIKSVLSETKCAKDIGGYMSKKDEVTAADQKAMENSQPGYESAMVHCKFDPALTAKEQNRRWYKRVIDGRLWGCSEALSKIKIFIDETYTEFEKEEKIFFRANPDIYNLGSKVIAREKNKFAKIEPRERELLRVTDEDIERKYRFMSNVFIHPHLSVMKKGATLQQLIHEEKMKRKKNFQRFFTDN